MLIATDNARRIVSVSSDILVSKEGGSVRYDHQAGVNLWRQCV